MPKTPHNNLYNWLFKCHDGKYVYGQAPNTPIIIAGIAYVLALFIQDPNLRDFFSLIFRLSVITWAVLELAWGANNFRRILGSGVLTIVSIGIIIG